MSGWLHFALVAFTVVFVVSRFVYYHLALRQARMVATTWEHVARGYERLYYEERDQ